MADHVLFVCKSCGFSAEEDERNGISGGNFLCDRLKEKCETWQYVDRVAVQAVGCLCICEQPCAIAISHPTKPTFLFVNLSPENVAADILKMCELYVDSDSGMVSRHLLPESMQVARLARIPALADATPRSPALG
ncbi:MAG: DUF1636 family protein [Oscillatoriales cyanobacterium SM2_1_8]|nr:DUF1636 family protein [Oscillatoriales cyanobacterium SM2_1_8]